MVAKISRRRRGGQDGREWRNGTKKRDGEGREKGGRSGSPRSPEREWETETEKRTVAGWKKTTGDGRRSR